jgi:putative nucleotidyltransferase with HDIG domain
VLQAANASEALETLRSASVDLATVDLNMPGTRGEELVRRLRAEHPATEVIVITGCGSLESAAEAVRLGVCDYLQKPFDVVDVAASVARALARKSARSRLVGFLEELGQVVGRERHFQAIVEDVERSQGLRTRVGGLFEGPRFGAPAGATGPRTEEFLEVLAETIESKDPYMRGHARRVASLACLLAERLRLSAREREELRLAAFLHDLGKVGIASDLLARPGALSPAERALVQAHPALGAQLLRPLDMPPAVAAAVRHHHEWWDGAGYPDGLSGQEIPLAARLIAVVDAYDAMTSDRPYRRALAPDLAISELRRFSAAQFDPEIAGEFVAILETGVLEVRPDFFANVALGPPREGAARP